MLKKILATFDGSAVVSASLLIVSPAEPAAYANTCTPSQGGSSTHVGGQNAGGGFCRAQAGIRRVESGIIKHHRVPWTYNGYISDVAASNRYRVPMAASSPTSRIR
jgi:hypothetical protein